MRGSQKQLVREAREAGNTTVTDGVNWIKRNKGVQVRPNLYSLFSSQLDKVAITEVPTTEVMPAKDIARVLNMLVKSAGVERVREMLDVVEEINK